MLLNHQCSGSHGHVIVLGSDAFRNEICLSRTGVSKPPDASKRSVVAKTSLVSDAEHPKYFAGVGLNSVARRSAQWTSLDWDDRQVFNIWARSVAIFYLLLVVALLGVILLGFYMSAGQNTLPISPAMERSLPKPA